MTDVFKVLDDVAFGARMVKKQVHMQYTNSGIHIMYVILLLALAFLLFLFLLFWPSVSPSSFSQKRRTPPFV